MCLSVLACPHQMSAKEKQFTSAVRISSPIARSASSHKHAHPVPAVLDFHPLFVMKTQLLINKAGKIK